jgi:hypothetical protein
MPVEAEVAIQVDAARIVAAAEHRTVWIEHRQQRDSRIIDLKLFDEANGGGLIAMKTADDERVDRG